MVNLTRIYTRTGDAGTTRLGDNSVTSKTDLRLHAYADVDELKVARIFVDEGAILKRMHARAKGRGSRISKRTSHITVVVGE